MDSDRMVQFTEAYRNLTLFPLDTPEQIEEFRVPYGQRTLVTMGREIIAAGSKGKLIFTGHRGCGKSTLLVALDRRMVEQELFVARFSIAKTIELSDVGSP